MEESESSDGELLADWLANRREISFRRVVERHAGMIHAAARRVSGDETLAAEASQMVFILLARKAASLTGRSSLSGWLHITTVMQTRNLVRRDQRENRKRRQLLDDMKTSPSTGDGGGWKDLRPIIDEAVASLAEADREAVVLHYYRALSVAEIASRLGIATDAARKRLERATGRLRSKLARRGFETGTSFSSILSTGLAADPHIHGAGVSLLVSKALSLASAKPVLPQVLLLMKASPFVPPVAALLIVGLLLVRQHHVAASLEEKIARMEERMSPRSGSDKTGFPSRVRPLRLPPSSSGGNGKIDWREMAAKFEDMARRGIHDDMEAMRLDYRLSRMPGEELLGALDEVLSLEVSGEARYDLKRAVCLTLARKFPEFAMERLAERMGPSGDDFFLPLALRDLANKNTAEAAAWLDLQIRLGRLDSGPPDGRSDLRVQFESSLCGGMFSSDPDGARRRLSALSVDDRVKALDGFVLQGFPRETQLSYLALVKDVLPPGKWAAVIAAQAREAGGFDAISEYLDLAGAAGAERASMVARISKDHLTNYFFHRKLAMDDMEETGAWVRQESPDAAEEIIGKSLAAISGLGGNKTTFTEMTELVAQLNHQRPSDQMLSLFLQGEGAKRNKPQARSLAGLISDEALRSEILRNLE